MATTAEPAMPQMLLINLPVADLNPPNALCAAAAGVCQ